jgi:hypothetical protein
MKSPNPLINVTMITYRYENCIKDAVGGVLMQEGDIVI